MSSPSNNTFQSWDYVRNELVAIDHAYSASSGCSSPAAGPVKQGDNSDVPSLVLPPPVIAPALQQQHNGQSGLAHETPRCTMIGTGHIKIAEGGRQAFFRGLSWEERARAQAEKQQRFASKRSQEQRGEGWSMKMPILMIWGSDEEVAVVVKAREA